MNSVDAQISSDDDQIYVLFEATDKVNWTSSGREQLYTWKECWTSMEPLLRESVIDKYMYEQNTTVLSLATFFVYAYNEKHFSESDDKSKSKFKITTNGIAHPPRK